MHNSNEHVIKLEMVKTNRPILRAGKANILLGISICGFFVVSNLLLSNDWALKIVGLVLSGLLVASVLTYLRAISRLEFREADFIAEGPISRVVVPYSKIECVRISISRLNPSISLRMQIRDDGVLRRGILEDSTDWGGLDATGSRIRKEFEVRGIRVASEA